MASKSQSTRMDHPVIVTFLVLAIVAFMYFAAEFLRPLVLAVLLSFALAPLTSFLERRRVPRALAVPLTVVVVLGALGGISYVVWGQLNALTGNMSEYQRNIQHHLASVFRPGDESALEKLSELGEQVTSQLEEPDEAAAAAAVQKVEVIERPTFQERLEMAVGPYLEAAGVGSFVMILVLFMLMQRENLSDRIIQLFGNRRISLTTRTMDEVGQRISRYIGMWATVNATFGLIIGFGLWLIGVEYAVLWGFLAAALRFIPYVGPVTAFVLPLVFSIASSETWTQPLMVLALFGVLEGVANSFLEPVIYGRTTGVSALGLLVAAMFWTWLWGALGLLLSTPMTVCLAVLGKYVPSLRAFATLLGEESELDPDVRFYQRVLALDQDGATEIIEEALKSKPRAEIYDTILIPALSRAERDFARNEIDEAEQAFLWRVTGEVLDDLDTIPEIELKTIELDRPKDGEARAQVLGVATNDTADALVLRMLGQVLRPLGVELEVLAVPESALALSERIVRKDPALVILSHLPPMGLTPARYLVRRLRSRLSGLPIVVGRWGQGGDTQVAEGQLKESGATHVVFTLAEARDRLCAPQGPAAGDLGPLPKAKASGDEGERIPAAETV